MAKRGKASFRIFSKRGAINGSDNDILDYNPYPRRIVTWTTDAVGNHLSQRTQIYTGTGSGDSDTTQTRTFNAANRPITISESPAPNPAQGRKLAL